MPDDLDTLLARPLADVADNGFSARTAALLDLQRLRRDRLRTEIGMGLVVLAVLTVPFTPLGVMLSLAAFTKAGSALVVLAAAVSFFVSQRHASFKRFGGSLA